MSALGVQGHLLTHRTSADARQPLRLVPETFREPHGTAFRVVLESRGPRDDEDPPKDIRLWTQSRPSQLLGFCLVGEYVTLAPAILDTGHGCEVRRYAACYNKAREGELTRVRAVLTRCALFLSLQVVDRTETRVLRQSFLSGTVLVCFSPLVLAYFVIPQSSPTRGAGLSRLTVAGRLPV